jgi:hypothetical protein
LWPAALGLWIVTVVLVLRFWKGRVSESAMSRLLAFHWAWSGIAYHAAFFTQVNPAAWVFAVSVGPPHGSFAGRADWMMPIAGLSLAVYAARNPSSNATPMVGRCG